MASTSKTTIYIVRHGESETNRKKILLEPMADALTEEGLHQAKLVGQALSGIKFTKAFTSPYLRTLQTAQIILESSNHDDVKNINLIQEPRLRERHMGVHENESINGAIKYLAGKYFKEGLLISEIEIDGSEDTCEKMSERVETFMENIFKIAEEAQNAENILVVSHAYWIQFFTERLKKNSHKFELQNTNEILGKIIPNCGYLEIEVSKQGQDSKRVLNFVKIHENGHLKKLEGDVLANYGKKFNTDGEIQEDEAVAAARKSLAGCIHQ